MAIINALPQGGAKSGYKHKVEIITSSTWTVPTGVTEIAVRLFGGGGGGYYDSTNSVSSGGGGGNMAYGVFSVTAGTSYAITIGSGATGSSAVGGSTSFGDLLKATGGEIGTAKYGGSGGTGGGTAWAVSSSGYTYACRGGYGTYGGGGAGEQNWYPNNLWYYLLGKGGIYGGQGGSHITLSDGAGIGGTGVEGDVGGCITDSTSYAWGGGGGGYKANGGNSYYGVALYGGGGGGWEGGTGGNADSSGHAGGGGGYGSTKLDITGACGGAGYGAGAGGDGSSSGAPGICVIYY